MAKQRQHTAQKRTKPAGVEPEAPVVAGASDRQLVIFRIGEGLFAFPLDAVAEILRPPALAYMPLGPRSLLGLANLRGVVLPVVSIRRRIGYPDKEPGETARVIVTAGAAPVGFMVDAIEKLLSAPGDRIDDDAAGAGAIDASFIDGVVKGAEGTDPIKILDPQRMLAGEFEHLRASRSRETAPAPVFSSPAAPAIVQTPHSSFVSFDLERQEYAVPLESVREIIPLPEHVSEVARSETAVVGVVTLRDRLLPLVSLRGLLGMPARSERTESGKVVVLSVGQTTVGVVADRTREIIHVDPKLIDAAPALLTRGAGDAEVVSICRLDDGKRLVAVLSPEKLFRSDLIARVLAEQGSGADRADGHEETGTVAEEQFVIFRLGAQDYGLPIAAVDEIARLPEKISKLPKAPRFIEGVMNLRGNVVPLVDLRRRFELASSELAAGRRILVLSFGGAKTGFLVDSVREVAKIPDTAIQTAPELSAEQMRLIGRVANLGDRMILLLDPAQLLDKVETDMLAKFEAGSKQELMNS
jgi:purine-binding chemotaxis protein CheW